MENLLIPQKNTIATQEIKEIVNLFNVKPLNENLTLVALDQLNTFELGDLISKIFKQLDPERVINSRETQPKQIVYKVSEFLKVLSYQCNFDSNWQQGLLNGDRKVIYPIYYYLLVNLALHKKRAYLAKYLVAIDIPEELVGDPDIKKLNEQYRESQAEFQVSHENFELINKDSLNAGDLKKQITQLEQQKDQLTSKIGIMKSKNVNKPEFPPLLEATNLLRKQQEQEARLVDKIQSQRAQLENAEAQLLSLQQAFADAKKSLAPSNTPQQMLQATKNQVRKNRELVKERMTFQYNQRFKKMQNTQRLLSEPPITQNQLMLLESQMMNLRRFVSTMEDKISKQNTQGDKLAIYKSQAGVVSKKKQQAFQSLKREQEELQSLESEIRKKEQQIHKLKGGAFKKNELEDYINQIKEKKVKYSKFKAEMEQLRWQLSNLKRTEEILLEQKIKYEKIYNIAEGVLVPDRTLDNASMEELTKQIDKLIDQINKRKKALQPQLDQKKTLQMTFQETEREYKAKKMTFDSTISKIEDEMKDLEIRVGKFKDEVYGFDTKIQIGRFKSEILESKISRLNEENQNIQGKGKGIAGYKSYQEFMGAKIKEREKQISQLAIQRQKVSDNHQPSLEQLTMFTDLKRLLQTKLANGKVESTSVIRKGEKFGNNVNVLKL